MKQTNLQLINKMVSKQEPIRLRDLCPEDKWRIANLIGEMARLNEENQETERRLQMERQEFCTQIYKLQGQQEFVLKEKQALQAEYLQCHTLLFKYQEEISEQQQRLNKSIQKLLLPYKLPQLQIYHQQKQNAMSLSNSSSSRNSDSLESSDYNPRFHQKSQIRLHHRHLVKQKLKHQRTVQNLDKFKMPKKYVYDKGYNTLSEIPSASNETITITTEAANEQICDQKANSTPPPLSEDSGIVPLPHSDESYKDTKVITRKLHNHQEHFVLNKEMSSQITPSNGQSLQHLRTHEVEPMDIKWNHSTLLEPTEECLKNSDNCSQLNFYEKCKARHSQKPYDLFVHQDTPPAQCITSNTSFCKTNGTASPSQYIAKAHCCDKSPKPNILLPHCTQATLKFNKQTLNDKNCHKSSEQLPSLQKVCDEFLELPPYTSSPSTTNTSSAQTPNVQENHTQCLISQINKTDNIYSPPLVTYDDCVNRLNDCVNGSDHYVNGLDDCVNESDHYVNGLDDCVNGSDHYVNGLDDCVNGFFSQKNTPRKYDHYFPHRTESEIDQNGNSYKMILLKKQQQKLKEQEKYLQQQQKSLIQKQLLCERQLQQYKQYKQTFPSNLHTKFPPDHNDISPSFSKSTKDSFCLQNQKYFQQKNLKMTQLDYQNIEQENCKILKSTKQSQALQRHRLMPSSVNSINHHEEIVCLPDVRSDLFNNAFCEDTLRPSGLCINGSEPLSRYQVAFKDQRNCQEISTAANLDDEYLCLQNFASLTLSKKMKENPRCNKTRMEDKDYYSKPYEIRNKPSHGEASSHQNFLSEQLLNGILALQTSQQVSSQKRDEHKNGYQSLFNYLQTNTGQLQTLGLFDDEDPDFILTEKQLLEDIFFLK